MGVQGPPHMLAFILAIVTAVLAIILLGLDGDCNRGACFGGSSNTPCAATALGIVAGVFGLIIGLLAIFWLLISELWDVAILKFVIVGGFFFTAVMSLIALILNAVAASLVTGVGFYYSRFVAAAVFSFLLMGSSALAGIFALMAGGGGTR